MSIVLPETSFFRLAVAVSMVRELLQSPAVLAEVEMDGRPIDDFLVEVERMLDGLSSAEPAARRALSGLKVPG